MNKSILTIMCSRERPNECFNAVESFLNTSSESDLTILLDGDDSNLMAYLEKKEHLHFYMIQKKDTITNRINQSALSNIDKYEFFHITNDDVFYHTKYWDKKFMETLNDYGYGIVYGNDLFQKENLPTFPFISSEIIKELGWLQMPLLNKYYGDMAWKILGIEANCLYHCQEIIIEHLHHLAGKGKYPVDMDIYKKDSESFARWIGTRMERDIGKIRRLNAIESQPDILSN